MIHYYTYYTAACGCRVFPFGATGAEIREAESLPCPNCLEKEAEGEFLRGAVCPEEPVLQELAKFYGGYVRYLHTLPSIFGRTPTLAGASLVKGDERIARFL